MPDWRNFSSEIRNGELEWNWRTCVVPSAAFPVVILGQFARFRGAGGWGSTMVSGQWITCFVLFLIHYAHSSTKSQVNSNTLLLNVTRHFMFEDKLGKWSWKNHKAKIGMVEFLAVDIQIQCKLWRGNIRYVWVFCRGDLNFCVRDQPPRLQTIQS